MTTHSKLPPRRRLPPYAAQQRHKKPSNGVWVFTGRSAWSRSRNDIDKPGRLVTLLPLGDDPAAYRWPGAGDGAVIVHTGGETAERLRALAVELIRQGATHVVVLDGDAKPQHFRGSATGRAAA